MDPVTRFKCPSCNRKLTWKAEQVGRRGKCACGQVLTVPMAADMEGIPVEAPAPSDASNKQGIVITAVLMDSVDYPLDELRQQLEGSLLAGRPTSDFKITNGGFLRLKAGDVYMVVAPMPAPYPWSDLKGPCATAWMWPRQTSASTLETHRSHVLITMFGGAADRIARRLLMTQLTAVVAQQPGVVGVYWPEGTLIHYPPFFIDMAKSITSIKGPPLYLWVDFRVFKTKDGGSGLFTTGMPALGHMEIEIPGIQMQPRALRDWAVNIAYYLLEKGPVLKDGNTIGMTADQQIRIHHRPSQFGHKGLVLRMEP